VVTVSPRRFRRVVWVAILTSSAIVLTGAAVRLTDSGLGCTDWPTCEEGRLAPAWAFHGWVEFGNRLFAGVVLASVVATLVAARWRRPYRRSLVWLSAGLVVGVLAQAVLGGITVLVELHPAAVIGHFLLSMVLLVNALVLLDAAGSHQTGPRRSGPLLTHTWVLVGLGAVVLVAGTLVTGTGPHGGDSRAERLPFDLASVARVHAVAVWVLVAGLVLLALRAARLGDAPLLGRLRLLLAVTVAQGGVGYLQFALGVPAGLVLVHILGAMLVWGGLVWVHLGVRRRGPLLADLAHAGRHAPTPEPVARLG
jgi:heme a synthase